MISEQDTSEGESCPKEGCPSTKTLQNMPKLGPDDTVFILFHGNAKVTMFTYTFNLMCLYLLCHKLYAIKS